MGVLLELERVWFHRMIMCGAGKPYHSCIVVLQVADIQSIWTVLG